MEEETTVEETTPETTPVDAACVEEEEMVPHVEEEIDPEVKKRNEEAMAYQEERINAVMNLVREKVFPLVVKNNDTVEETKRMLDTLGVTFQQAMFLVLKEKTIESLNLKEKISTTYPGYEKFIEVIDALAPSTMEDAIEAVQWMSKKIDGMIQQENKTRTVNDLGIEI